MDLWIKLLSSFSSHKVQVFICSAGVIPLLTILLVVYMIADPLQSKPVHL